MAEYKRVRKYDVTFLTGTSTSAQLTSHLNNRLQQLINIAGGSEYLETIATNIQYVDKSNPSNFSMTESVSNEIEERVTQPAYTQEGWGNNPDTSIPAVKENVVTSFEKVVSNEVKEGTTADELSVWLIYIEYDQTVQVA
tara:strand:- start:697 stop:1116 length:420 start_codon:yes stop_codon:yes gene_type:complete